MIGRPIDRVDGPLKVTGRATYTWEQWGAGQPLYGFIVTATIGRGRITRIDTSLAEQAPGVRRVMTHLNTPPQGVSDLAIEPHYNRAMPMLSGPEIHVFGQPVALVVATTFEQARGAASLVDVTYERAEGHYDFAANTHRAYTPKHVNAGLPTDTAVGTFDAAFDSAPVRIDVAFTTPYTLSQPMEPNACLAVWSGDEATVWVSSQIVIQARIRAANTLLVDPAHIRVLSPYVGGGFGSKLGIHGECILAMLAARELGQPVKVGMTRQQTFQLIGHRPTSAQRVRLGADRDGHLIAFGHDAAVKTSTGGDFVEQTATSGRALYAAPHRLTRHRAVPLDLPPSEDVRAPGEAPGMLAIETAMDELARTLDLDPVELRIRNEPTHHPETGVPFSDRRLVACLREGAQRFGWEGRPRAPGSRREGDHLVGHGMSSAIRPHFQLATQARVRLGADGVAVVQSDMTDIGTGTYTVLTQVAAEALGLPVDRVRVELGDSDFPVSGGSGASWGASNTGTAVHRACLVLRERLLASLTADPTRPLQGPVFRDGRITADGVSEDLTAVVARSFPTGLEATGSVLDETEVAAYSTYSLNSYGAYFAEVRVDVDTGEIRVRRMLGVFAPGRVLNHKTARSQLIGGMIWGVGAVLHEQAVVDTRTGAFVNRDFAEYLIPVHADIPAVEAVLLDGCDDQANDLGCKGIGELGICGSGAAIANAVFDATGVRVRDFPITLEQLLPSLPSR